VTVESVRNAENVVDTAFEIESPVGEEEPALAVPEDPVGEEESAEAVPDPPAAVDNWANPTDGGEERNTEYTFFRNVSPTTQLGLEEPPAILLVPRLRSKMAPMHKTVRPSRT